MVGVLAVAGLASGCASEEPTVEQTQAAQIVEVEAVVDRTSNDYFTVDTEAGAQLVTDHAGGGSFPSVRFPITVTHTNGTKIFPVVELRGDSGLLATCEEDDPRRHPYLQEEQMSIEVPCPYIPQGVSSVVIRGE